MRPYCTAYSSPEAALLYVHREGAEHLGGTVPYLDPFSQLERFQVFSGPQMRFQHVTLSLPKGLRADDGQWLQIVAQAMEGLGLDSRITPWTTFRHTDKDCDHTHTVIALCDFAGRRLSITTSDAACQQVHRDLCTRLGLPEPAYDDGRPTLTPVTPARRVKSDPLEALYDALTHAFARHQPENMESLNAVMGRFKAKAVVNSHGV